MATKPKLELVKDMTTFEEALGRISAFRTAILTATAPAVQSMDMSFIIHEELPAVAITLHIAQDADAQKIYYYLQSNPISGYRFEQVNTRRNGMSLTRHIVTAIVVGK